MIKADPILHSQCIAFKCIELQCIALKWSEVHLIGDTHAIREKQERVLCTVCTKMRRNCLQIAIVSGKETCCGTKNKTIGPLDTRLASRSANKLLPAMQDTKRIAR